MDKKNTMLLTVIAVATLLVAVVGATFAYFSVQAGAEGNTTAVNGTVASAGVVTGTVGEDAVHVNLTNTDMRLANAGTYYAVATDSGADYSKDAELNHSVFSATLANAAEGETYTCKFNMEVTVTGNEKFAAGDAALVLNGVGDADFDGTHDLKYVSYDDNGAATELTDKFTGIVSKQVTWTFDSANTSEAITMDAYIVNKDDTVQNASLANTDLEVKVNVTGFACDVAVTE